MANAPLKRLAASRGGGTGAYDNAKYQALIPTIRMALASPPPTTKSANAGCGRHPDFQDRIVKVRGYN
jgi:hypothetical protein